MSPATRAAERGARRLALSLLVAAALGARARPAHAWCATTTQRASAPGECVPPGPGSIPLRWTTICTGYSLYRAGSPEMDLEAIRVVAEQAAARWHATVCDPTTNETPYFQLQPIADTWAPTGYNPRDNNANTVSFNSVWRSDAAHRPGSIAITIVTFDTMSGEILDGDVEMNQRDAERNPDGFTFSSDEMTPMDAADLPTILTHEFGHFHGISHSGEMNAVMWFEAGLGQARREITPDDAAAICETYPEFRRPERRVCNPTPYGGFAVSNNGTRIVGACAASAPTGGDHAAARGWGVVSALLVAAAAAGGHRRRRLRRV